jgi:hypothetical protein
LNQAGIAWRRVDIDEDPRLEKAYGLRVPVLRRPDSGHELDYPFDEARVADFIRGSTA